MRAAAAEDCLDAGRHAALARSHSARRGFHQIAYAICPASGVPSAARSHPPCRQRAARADICDVQWLRWPASALLQCHVCDRQRGYTPDDCTWGDACGNRGPDPQIASRAGAAGVSLQPLMGCDCSGGASGSVTRGGGA
jgi:hypothetical protein